MAPKRRASMQKATAYVESLGEVEEWKEHKQLIEHISGMLKQATTPTLRAVRSILVGGDEAAEGPRLPRGIKQLGGANNVCIPNYIAVNCLSKVTKCPKSLIGTLSADDRRNLFMFGIGGEPETLVPERKDFVSNFEDFWVKQYTEHGERFKNLKIERDMVVDWVGTTGYFQLLSKSCELDKFDSLHCRLTGEIVPLPRQTVIPKVAVGRDDGFELVQNWLLHSAKLVDHSVGCEFSLAKQFSPIDAGGKAWDPLHCPALDEVLGSHAGLGPVRVAGKRPAGDPPSSPPAKAPRSPKEDDDGRADAATRGLQEEASKVSLAAAGHAASSGEPQDALAQAAKEIEEAMGAKSEGSPALVPPPP